MSQAQDTRTKGVTVELNDGDVQDAVEVGRGRDGVYIGKGAASVDPERRTKIHIMGAKGEFALARYWNIPPNDVVLDSPDPGYDYEVRIGGVDAKVDVKATEYDDGDLIVRPPNASVPDVFVLTRVAGVAVRLVGYLSARRLTAEHDPVNDFERPVYRVPGDDLKPLPAPDEVTVIE